MIFVFHGEDTFRSYEKLAQIKVKFKKEVDPSGVNIEQLDGEKLKAADFLHVAFATGFLVSKRLTIVKDLMSKGKDKQTHEVIRKSLEETKTDNILVFYESELIKQDKRKRKNPTLLDFLLSQQYVQTFDPLSSHQLEQWVKEYAMKEHVRIEMEALKTVVASVGSDLWHMHQVLDLLIAYTKGLGKEEISVDMVQSHVKAQIDAQIFALTDAMGKGQGVSALQQLQQQFQSGAHELYLLTMLIRQVKLLLEVKSHFSFHAYTPQAAKSLGHHPFVVKKAFAQSQGYELEHLKKMYAQLIQIEGQAKTGQGDPKTRLSIFVLQK